MIICGTGHRPDKLGGYKQEVFDRLVTLAWDALDDIRPTEVIVGMALGWDQALAQAAINAGVPFHAYCPCWNQDNRWPPPSRKKYSELLDQAESIRYTHKGGYPGPWCMQQRNVDMVDAAECVLTLWDGSDGGTGNCIDYATKQTKTVINLWDEWSKQKMNLCGES